MASVALSSKAVGSIVKIKVNGTLRDFIVVQQGKPSSIYDESCNGTWLLMKDLYESRQWHSSNVNDYANSTIHKWLNNEFLNLIDANIRAQIRQLLFFGQKTPQEKKQAEQNERRKQWRLEHPEEARARDRAAYQRKKAKKLAEASMTQEELEAKRKAEAEEKAARHEESVKRQRERYAARYAEHREAEAERKRKWYQENKERIKAQQRDYRLRAGLLLSTEEKEARKAAAAQRFRERRSTEEYKAYQREYRARRKAAALAVAC